MLLDIGGGGYFGHNLGFDSFDSGPVFEEHFPYFKQSLCFCSDKLVNPSFS